MESIIIALAVLYEMRNLFWTAVLLTFSLFLLYWSGRQFK